MHNNKSRGFSLIEVIVAMMIIAIMALSAFQFYVFCMNRLIMNARLNLIATDFGRVPMEERYFLSPGSLTNSFNTFDLEAGQSCNRSCNITSNTNYLIVETAVTWTR